MTSITKANQMNTLWCFCMDTTLLRPTSTSSKMVRLDSLQGLCYQILIRKLTIREETILFGLTLMTIIGMELQQLKKCLPILIRPASWNKPIRSLTFLTKKLT